VKNIKETYVTILILTYCFNFFGGGFFYLYFILRNEDKAVFGAILYMFLSLFLYLKMDTDLETVFEAVKRPSFQIIILVMYFLPIVLRGLTPTK
jgi:hypothetical protein